MTEFEGAIGPDRRTFLKRLVVGAAFATPVVSSFTMSGINSVFASAPGSTTLLSHGNTYPYLIPNFPDVVDHDCYFVVPGVPVDYSVSDLGGTVQLHLTGPANAFEKRAIVCIYRADLSALASVVPSGETPVSGYAVIWDPGEEAVEPLTLTVTDPSVTAGSPIYLLDKKTGTTPVAAGTATAGQWVVTFKEDPPYVVTRTPSAPTPPADPIVSPAITFTG